MEPLAGGARLPAWMPSAFGRVVAAAFGQRRKTLRNALADAAWMSARFAAAGVDPQARAETLGDDDVRQRWPRQLGLAGSPERQRARLDELDLVAVRVGRRTR